MSPIECTCRNKLAESPDNVIDFLKGRREPCRECGQNKVVDVMIQQFRTRRPRWWVVDGVALVPIWVLERLRKELTSIV